MKVLKQIGVNNAGDLRDFLNEYTDQELTDLCFDHINVVISIDEHTLSDGSTVENMRFITELIY